jgi:hypothetical protein
MAGGWAVLEVVRNVPVDLAACVQPWFVHLDGGHCVPNRPLEPSTPRVVANRTRNRGTAAARTPRMAAQHDGGRQVPQSPPPDWWGA